MCRVVADAFHYSEAFCLALAEKYSVPRGQKFRSLDKSESDKCSVTGSDEGSVNVNHSASLADSSNVEHSLVSGLDSGRVR